jgi:hypothetical protein
MDFATEVKKQSTLTVLDKSRELFALIAKVEADDNLIPKYFKESLGIPIVTHARDIYENLAVANSIDLFDKDMYETRRKYQLQALYCVAKLLATLRIVYTLVQLSADKMQVLLTKTIEVKRLAAKWMESDKNRIGASLQIVAKDPIETNLFDKGITARDLFNDTPRVDFDAIYKAASSSPIPERHHETGQTFYIPPPTAPKTVYKNEAAPDTRTREQRIADMLAGRKLLDQRPEVADAPEGETVRVVQAKPLGTADPDNSIGPTIETPDTEPVPVGPLSENIRDVGPQDLVKQPKRKK